MRHIVYILVITLLLIGVLFLITNPELLEGIWLWIIGLIGGIVGLFRNIFDQLGQLVKKEKQQELELAVAAATPVNNAVPVNNASEQKLDSLIEKIEEKELNAAPKDDFDGTTINVLRYSDDGETTLGLLYIRNEFFAYTLEDTYHEDKIAGETRIPAGNYELDFLKVETGLTKKYRERFSWFNYHLEIKNIPNYTGVYIHIGNNHKHTKGCLLIADGINASSVKKTIVESTNAYKRFYMRMSDLLASGEKLRIVIKDENWFKKSNLHNN